MTTDIITTSKGVYVRKFDDQASNLLDKSIVIYGKSNSGKTTIIKHLLHKLMPYAPAVFVVCPTEPSNGTYGKFLPKELIHHDLYPDANGETFLTKFLQWQESRTVTYKAVNDIKHLLMLYNKLPDKRINEYIDKIKINRKKGGNESKYDILLSNILKKHIYEHRDEYNKVSITDIDKMILKYTYINAHAIIIFDDCAATFKSVFKSKEFRDLFYQGRHKSITLMLSCQDNTDLESYLRKNASINIYTQSAVVMSNFGLASNGYSKDVGTRAKDIAATLFADATKYLKMVFVESDNTNEHFYYIKAGLSPIRVNSIIRKICRKTAKSQTEIPKTNRYANTFKA